MSSPHNNHKKPLPAPEDVPASPEDVPATEVAAFLPLPLPAPEDVPAAAFFLFYLLAGCQASPLSVLIVVLPMFICVVTVGWGIEAVAPATNADYSGRGP